MEQPNNSDSHRIPYHTSIPSCFIPPHCLFLAIRGSTGPRGSVGATGAVGATGSRGPQGPQGPRGWTGSTGSTGPRGYSGHMGPNGYRGAIGKNANYLYNYGSKHRQFLFNSVYLLYQKGGLNPVHGHKTITSTVRVWTTK